MSTSPLIPILIVVACLLLAVGILVPLLSVLKRRAADNLRSALGSVPILRSEGMANYFGLQSKGFDVRGNGALMLTADKLGFMLALGNKQPLIIERSAITKVETVKSHMGKTIGRPLLAVHFTNAGSEDSVAWYVQDLNGWIAALQGGRQ